MQSRSKEGRHIKLLVTIDISLLLFRGSIILLNSKKKWINCKYDRCPNFVTNCGIIGHID